MSSDDPLSRKIATLSAKDHFDGAALKLGASGGPEAMAHILQAIDDTMMLRDAVFAVGDSAVTLRVSGKRVLMVAEVTDDLSPPDGLVQKPLTSDTPDAIAQLGEILQALVAQKGTLTLERAPAQAAAKQGGSGVGIQTLTASWSKPTESAPVEDVMAAFVEACSDTATVLFLVQDGKREVVLGDQLWVEVLDGLCGKKWSQLQREHCDLVGDQSPPAIHASDALGPLGQSFVSAVIDEKQCFMLVSSEKLPHVIVSFGGLASPR